MHWPNGDQIQYGQDENYDPAIIRIQSEGVFRKMRPLWRYRVGRINRWRLETDDISAVVAWFILNIRKSPSCRDQRQGPS